jgi:membrane-associated phospholipid phosphatase
MALAGTGIALAAAAIRRGRSIRPAIVILLGLAIGPGLLVNVVLKDHWHRPRPRQTLGLGGDFTYVPPFRIGPVGKSFPCGHSAIGFACVALAALVETRRARVRGAVVASALALGALLGLGRVATGAHFVSDVVWSGVLTCGSVLFAAWVAGRISTTSALPWPGAEVSARRRVRRGWVVTGGLAALGALASALLCFPFRHDAEPHLFPLSAGAGTELDVRIEVGHARLILVPPGAAALSVESRHDGFGVPWGGIDESLWAGPAAPGAANAGAVTTNYRLAPRGWFADLEGTTILRVPAGSVARIEIDVADGHLTVDDESGGAALPAIVCRIRRDALRLRGPLRRDQLEVVER